MLLIPEMGRQSQRALSEFSLVYIVSSRMVITP